MYKKDKDYIFRITPSRFIPAVQSSLWGLSALCVLFGPFLALAKIIFAVVWGALAFYYCRQLLRQRSYAQLRLSNGNLLLVFRDGQEPQLVYFSGAQRILPWLVELNLKLENDRVIHWAVAYDAMDAASFRQLKVFVQTRADQLQYK